jgi:hypothetical protein
MRNDSRLLIAALLVGCSSTPAPEPEAPEAVAPAVAKVGDKLTVAFTNNLDGEIEPCG